MLGPYLPTFIAGSGQTVRPHSCPEMIHWGHRPLRSMTSYKVSETEAQLAPRKFSTWDKPSLAFRNGFHMKQLPKAQASPKFA
ncbi:hypothetical protein P7K49_030014, partial [Saguinus oedipus]